MVLLFTSVSSVLQFRFENMSEGLPPFRTTLPAAYSSPRGQRKIPNQNVYHAVENVSNEGRKSGQSSPPDSYRSRSGSAGKYEGLIFDRSPEETERISKKLSRMLEIKSGGSSNFLGVMRGKMRSTLDGQAKRMSAVLPSMTVPPISIITRQRSLDGTASDSALVRRDIADSEEGILDVYSFVMDDPEKAYAQFMKAHRCYDVIPLNAKMVVLDTKLEVRKAFYALIYNSVRAAIVWNSENDRLCGMLTITDFIFILLRLYRTEKTAISTNLEKHLICEWRNILEKEGKLRKLTTVTANTSLFRAVQVLLDSGYHRIPVLDEENGNPMYFLTHKRILRFLFLYLEQLPRPKFMNESVRELGVGTYHDVQCVHPDTPLAQCLQILTSRRMSAVPVVERRTKVVVDIYARFDAIGLAVQQSYDNLDKTVAEALQHRKVSAWYEGVLTCLETDKFWDVVQKLVIHEVHGLVVVDEKNALRGVLTLSDVLRFMLLRTDPDEPRHL